VTGQAGGSADAGSYSGTNTAVAGVDEPDLVKSDGRHIVTVIGGVLRVVDAQTQQVTGVLELSSVAGLDGAAAANLLLAGNHALVLFDQTYPVMGGPAADLPPAVSPQAPQPSPVPINGPRLLLIDLSTGIPTITSSYTMDGSLVDARQVGSVARVVIHSAPRLFFPPVLPQAPGASAAPSAQQRTAMNRAVIAHSTVNSWLPRYLLTVGATQRTGLVDCAATSHPAAAAYSGTSMLTVLTFDLASNALGDGEPVTVVADGNTVYSNGSSLYIASTGQWSMPAPAALPPGAAGAAGPGPAQFPVSAPAVSSATGSASGTGTTISAPALPSALPQQYTGIYKFDISGTGRPVYQAAGTVPGWLLGSTSMAQYALSDWNGALRVATTSAGGYAGWTGQPPQSAVYVLEQAGDVLVPVGKVGGLGKGEQIYAVRFAGPAGYVVTFRQTDPLYTLDLSDPAQPRVAGELQLRGYSAYLDPIDATHLIGVGQDADATGQTQGTQISLFDVADLTAPVRLAVFRLRFGHSAAEFDPHAFLYWPASRLLVIPVQLPSAVTPVPPPGSGPVPQGVPTPLSPASEAVVLRVGDHTLTEMGAITHPALPGFPAGGQIERSLVLRDALWTLSETGLKANDLTTLGPTGWVPFS
jgi:hypothetical protein